MDNTKDDAYYLNKILRDLEFLLQHTQSLTMETFHADEVLQDSVMFRLIQVSENSAKLTDTFKERNSSVAWFAIRGLRNRIVHDYGDVDLSVIYDTIIFDIPELYKNLLKAK